MIKELLKKVIKPKKKDFKTLQFYKFALFLKAIEPFEDGQNIDIKKLLEGSYNFLQQDKVLTNKQQKEFNTFKDRYNRYLEYCIEQKFVKKDHFKKVEKLNTITVPDMSKIKVPNLEKELEEMDIDLDKIADLFSKMGKNSQTK